MVHDPNDPAAAQDGVASRGSITLTRTEAEVTSGKST
jgi:hypothetical protein